MNLVRQNKNNVTVSPGTWYAVIVGSDPRAFFALYSDAASWFESKYPARPAHEICAVTIA